MRVDGISPQTNSRTDVQACVLCHMNRSIHSHSLIHVIEAPIKTANLSS